MNPLSPFTYYRRHKRWAVLLLTLIGLATAGIYILGGLSLEMFFTPYRSVNMFLKNFSMVWPRGDALDPPVVSQIRANPDVARVIQAKRGLEIDIPNLVIGESELRLFGVQETDVLYVMEMNDVTLKEGRLLQPQASEIMLSDKVATPLGLQLGDMIDRSMNAECYKEILEPMEVVGILTGDVRLALISYEYLDSHELYRESTEPVLLITAQKGRKATVDNFLENEIASDQVRVDTFRLLAERIARLNRQFYFFSIPLTVITTIVITIVVGIINQIAFARRLPEFGLLHATGHSKKWLTRRLALETTILSSMGWATGIGLAWSILYIIGLTIFIPRGHDFNPVNLAPLGTVIPIPISVIGFTLVSVRRILSQLDPVAIIERGELSQEEKRKRAHKTPVKAPPSPKPLSVLTFYKRHARRAVLVISAMALMIMVVSLIIFNYSISEEAAMVKAGDYRHLSTVWPEFGHLDPGVVALVRAYPAVERVIVAARIRDVSMSIPPFDEESINTYGVSAEDMAYLIDLYGLQIKEGHLPRPYTNEIIIAEATARNRTLQVGDVIGNPDSPAYEGAEKLPAAMVISGIFARPSAPEDENWLSLASLEFMDSHENYAGRPRRLLVVPKVGQKVDLDEWLESKISGNRVGVTTYQQTIARIQERMRTIILVIGLIESTVVIVATVTLAVLNYIFISQRQSEFGMLNALGFSRLRLVWRTVRETVFTTGLAWGLSAVLCLVALAYLKIGVFNPLGLSFNLFTPTPWLSTIPIPIAVLIVTGGTTGRTLSRLDPVAIIERNSH